MITTVHLVRHGEVFNPTGALYGRLPGYGLSDRGRAMAHAAADALRGRDVAVVVASPLERARETADPIAADLGVAVDVDERLIESANVFQGAHLQTGRDLWRMPLRVVRYGYNPLRPSWGEPFQEVVDRMLAVIYDVRHRAAGREAVCVSHQLPIWVTRRALEGRPLWHHPRRRLCALGSITSLQYADDRLVAISYVEPSGPVARNDPAPASQPATETS